MSDYNKGDVVFMKASSGMTGYGNAQCISSVCDPLSEISLYGHNQLYRFSDIARVVKPDPYEVDSTHTDPDEKETALVLKYRQRARVAEELNEIMNEALVFISRDRNSPPILAGTWEETSKKWQAAWSEVTNRATYALNECLTKQLEGIPKKSATSLPGAPTKGGE
jgi:hypothetical protein